MDTQTLLNSSGDKSGLMNRASSSSNPMDESDCGTCQENKLVRLHCAKCKVKGRGGYDVELFFKSCLRPLVLVKGTLNALAYDTFWTILSSHPVGRV